jgi:ribonuclease Z
MRLARIGRLFVALAAALFAVAGLGFWAAPTELAAGLGLESTGPQGLVALRADLGGLFLGMALLCGAGLSARRRTWLSAAAVMLGAIACGRVVGWLFNGSPDGGVVSLVIELVTIGALITVLRETAPLIQVRTTNRRIPRWALAAAALLVIVGTGAAIVASSSTVQQAIFDMGAEQATANVNTAPFEDNAIRVAICGSSAPLPSASRAKPCVAVFAGGKFYIVDSGPESTENLLLWGIPMSRVGAVLLTHFHSDHIGDLGELGLQTWAGGRPSPLAVYGGPGVERVVAGFNEAYKQDQGYRTEHHTEKVMPSATWPMIAHTVELDGEPTDAKDRIGIVLQDGDLRITAIEVDHAPIAPAYAYRFDYKGRSVVVTGDLKNHPALATSSKGADLLVSEAIQVSMTRSLGASAKAAGRDNTARIMHDIEDYHITPEQAARIANEADVKMLVFYHLLPSPDGFLPRRLFSQGLSAIRPSGWAIAEDGDLYTLPIGSDRIKSGRIGG